jgi:DNA polymerase-3 subunit gamma/tau
MSHQALARKHRPRTFSEVATQEHVSETLRRAVSGDRVGHAYLFCGPRGVGKTTLARVLAMALNCPERTDEGEPCGVCESCQRIWAGNTALDVVEIDAASNRGVEAARDLRERAMYAPSAEGRFKVYIVDEAHMLTREAWNALLKVLEEPPPRVIFIFATTEPQKIQQAAAPILSRCQRFDFRRIGVADITTRLQEVLEREGTSAPAEALRLLARKADGGMRDGLSLLDQVLALSGGEISVDAVRRVLGLVDDDRYLELLDLLQAGRHGDVFGFVEGLMDEGYDLSEFYYGLVDVLRLVLRLRLTDDAALPELPDHLREAYMERATGFVAGDLVRMLALASELESTGSLRRSGHPRLLVEMLLLRLSYLERTVDLETLLRGLGGAPPPAGPPDRAPRAPSRPQTPDAARTSPQAQTPDAARTSPQAPVTEAAGTSPLAPVSETAAAPRASKAAPASPPKQPARKAAPASPPASRPKSPAEPPATWRDVLEGPASASPPEGGERIGQEAVRAGRLKVLIEKEPLLERAVEELDLELMD